MGKLEGKTALITGGNSGIGLATAKEFVNEGAYVFITGRRDPELAAAVKEIGRNVSRLQGDVANLSDLDRLFAQITREKGRLDIVFANAGVAEYAALGSITEKQEDDFQQCSGRQVRHTRGDRQGRGVSRVRRQQLRHGNRAVRGWRFRPGVGLRSRRPHP